MSDFPIIQGNYRLNQGSVDCTRCKVRELVLFSRLSDEDFQHIHEPIHDLHTNQGDHLYKLGESGEFIYTLRSGMIKLEAINTNRETKVVRLLGRGDVVGLEAILSEPYQHSAIVLNRCKVCRIPVNVIRDLRTHKPALCEDLMRRWNKSVKLADEWLADLHAGKSRQRIIKLVQFLTANSDDVPNFLLPSGEDISAILGLTRETVSRILADLKRENLILPLGDGTYESHIS